MIASKSGRRLAVARIAWFSSVRPDGSPHTVPVWFAHDRDYLWVASPASSRKVANVRHNDRVTLAVDGSAPQSLVAMARAELKWVFGLIATLPDRCREVFRARRIYGLSQHETAQSLGISEGIVEQETMKGMELISDMIARVGVQDPASLKARKSKRTVKKPHVSH